MARDLPSALSYGPEFFEQRYVFRIPTHGRYYTPTDSYRLFIVRLAHDRRFGASLSSSLSSSGSRGGIVLRMITKELRSINLVENSLGDVLLHVVAPRVLDPRHFTRFAKAKGHLSQVCVAKR
jgi:hypothetical protein